MQSQKFKKKKKIRFTFWIYDSDGARDSADEEGERGRRCRRF
jgi:hypothetical protein